jgi:hypothetical protein
MESIALTTRSERYRLFMTATNSAWGEGTRFPFKIPSIFDKKAAPLILSVLLLVIM